MGRQGWNLQYWMCMCLSTIFWGGYFKRIGAMEQANVILGGDLNLTLTMGEVWGENSRKDALGNFFLDFFEKRKLVDVVPLKLEPT